LGEKVVKLQPLPIDDIPNYGPNVCRGGTIRDKVARYVK
jgi:hypothetical protein